VESNNSCIEAAQWDPRPYAQCAPEPDGWYCEVVSQTYLPATAWPIDEVALRRLGTARTGAYFSLAPFIGATLAVALGAPLTLSLLAAALLMGWGVWLHLSEHHSHWHRHDPLRHEHSHVHDEHHRHSHDHDWQGEEPHTHVHDHEPLEHEHAHFPDIHHRHRHP